MALQAFNDHATAAMNNIAAAFSFVTKNGINGGKGWLQYSDITWITTAGVWALVKMDNYSKVTGLNLDANDSAKLVAIACSIASIIKGIFDEGHVGGKDKKLNELENKKWIYWTNALAAGLYAAHRFGLNKNSFETIALTLSSIAVIYFVPDSRFTK